MIRIKYKTGSKMVIENVHKVEIKNINISKVTHNYRIGGIRYEEILDSICDKNDSETEIILYNHQKELTDAVKKLSLENMFENRIHRNLNIAKLELNKENDLENRDYLLGVSVINCNYDEYLYLFDHDIQLWHDSYYEHITYKEKG